MASAGSPSVHIRQFLDALNAGDVDRVRTLLETHDEVRGAVNAPIGDFGGRPLGRAKKNLPLFDLLLSYSADPTLKSDWGPGPFGLLEYDCTPEDAAPLIARGVPVDIFAAAHLAMFDRVKALVDADPSRVHARGGDGKTALHNAMTVEIAQFLIDRGAAIDIRDIDHESTPAQYLVREAPDVTKLLLRHGARPDIFMAVALGDVPLVERCLREDPHALDHRTGRGRFDVTTTRGRIATPEEMGDRRGNIYRWVFDHYVSAFDVAESLGRHEIFQLLMRHATPAQRLLAACARGDRAAAELVAATSPGLVASLTREEMGVIADRAFANDAEAVLLMLDVGFDPLARGNSDWEAVRWAGFHGNVEMLARLLPLNPPLNTPDPSYGGTMLGNSLYGSVHGWQKGGDYPSAVRMLIAAGERVKPDWVPFGRADVDAVLRHVLAKNSGK